MRGVAGEDGGSQISGPEIALSDGDDGAKGVANARHVCELGARVCAGAERLSKGVGDCDLDRCLDVGDGIGVRRETNTKTVVKEGRVAGQGGGVDVRVLGRVKVPVSPKDNIHQNRLSHRAWARNSLVKANTVSQELDEGGIDCLVLGVAELRVDAERGVDGGVALHHICEELRIDLQVLDKRLRDNGLVGGDGKVELQSGGCVYGDVDISLNTDRGATDAVAYGGVLEAGKVGSGNRRGGSGSGG